MRAEVVNASSVREIFLGAAEFSFATLMRLVPLRWRFGASMLIAGASLPLFRLTNEYREQRLKGFDNSREIALHFVLNALSKNGTQFQIPITLRGSGELERALASGKGVLVMGPHAALTVLMVRLFHDRGLNPVVVTPDPRMRISGTKLTAQTLQPSPTFLVKIMNALRRGEMVCAMPDRAEHHGERTVEFTTVDGRVIVSPALMRVAAHSQAKVIFTEVHLEGRKLVATLASASTGPAGANDTITKDFIEFVRARAEARSTYQY